MASTSEPPQQFLTPRSVTTLKTDDAHHRTPLSRAPSIDMRAEQEDLKTAAEQSLNVILDLGLDGMIRWVSQSWKDIVGTLPQDVKGKPIADLCVTNQDAFSNAAEGMKSDDPKCRIIRFKMVLGPYSVLRTNEGEQSETGEGDEATVEVEEQEQVINLKGQGIMVYDRSSGGESHTMWMLRPSSPPKEVTIDLPELLVDSLGVGAEMLAQYLTIVAESGVSDPESHPPPLPIMCRICEQQITPWWFERHTEGCTQEHRAESEVTTAQDSLTEHRHAIVKVLDALDPDTRQGRPPVSGETSTQPPIARAEYKGLSIGPSAHSSPSTDSNRGSPIPSRSPSVSGLTHSRSKSFAVRRPISKIVTLLVDLCDTALDISMPTIKQQEHEENNLRSQSPQSESRTSQVLAWQTPSVAASDDEQGLAALIRDTENLAQAKVDTVLRYREILEYTERIRLEFNDLILDCIDAAIKKASSIKAGDLSDSSSENENEASSGEQAPAGEAMAHDSEEVSTPISLQRRDSDSPSVLSHLEKRKSSIAASSTRSSSPMECPTPRSHVFGKPLSRSDSLSKRHSMLFESDTADSDTNMSRSAMICSRRTESPEIVARSTSAAGERKRRSLKLPNMPSPHRNPSPARISVAPASPLRMPKPRIPLGNDSRPESMPPLPSPITSPPLSNTEASSPLIPIQRHRRQSSAASSVADPNRPPASPRLGGLSQPPNRPISTSIKDFEIIKPISKGAFGSVYLSKKKSTGDYFAIKVLRKADMVAKNQVTNVKAERAIMMWQGESDFVAKLYWTFSSKDYLFLVMEYLNGGDCAALVKVLGCLPEDWAKKYIAEVVQGIEHLHSRGIVHRDIKPDNLLIDPKGHLKLTDFGLSRMGLIGRQKRALKSPSESTPDLLKHGPFARATSITSSRSASFDFGGNNGPSPQSTPVMTPDLAGGLGQPSYFSLNRDTILGREHSRRKSGYRSDSGNSDTFSTMFRNFSLNDETSSRGERIEEETHSDSGSPDLYALRPTISNQNRGMPDTPPQAQMPPPPLALFDPEDQTRRFVGTPDYLAPETINGVGQDEMSDWWSLGCILFEFLYGIPPFHADTPEKVFENILARRIAWPSHQEFPTSEDAKDIMSKLMTVNPKERLGSNIKEKHSSGGEEIRLHPWFEGTNWETLLEDEASFIPAPEHPEDTDYFDARGATLQSFNEEMEDQGSSPALTPSAELAAERPHDALSRVRSQVNSAKRGLMPLHIPPHVRESRSRRLSEPVATDDFGSFAFKNLPVLEKANKDLLQKMRVEAAQKQAKSAGTAVSSATSATGPSLEGSPLLQHNNSIKRSLSSKRPKSPSGISQPSASPNRVSQPSSPLVSFSTGQSHERRKTSSASSTLSHQSSVSLQPGHIFEPPRLPISQSMTAGTSVASSPVKSARHSMNMLISSPEKGTPASSRPQSMFLPSTSRARSQTVGSQESADSVPHRQVSHNKRHSQVIDISPSSSDGEDPRAKALLRVQRRRQSSRRMSQFALGVDVPAFRPLDVLICEDHPVSRLVMERLLEKLKCRTITVANGPEAARYAMSEVQFDIIMMEFKLPQISGADVARMIRDTKSANSQTPIIAVTGYLNELPSNHHFDALIEKPATVDKITEVLQNLCHWRAPPPNYNQQAKAEQQQHTPPQNTPSGLRQESRRSDDSPSSQSSGPFSHIPGLRKRSSREHSIGSSFFGDTDSTNTEDIPSLLGRPSDDWPANKGLGISKPPFIPPGQDSKGESPPIESFHPGLPHLIHQNSAPASIDLQLPRKKRSAEAVKAKREDFERNRHECAESGDDEDEELGHVQVRTRSPRRITNPAKRSSKLGIEMMRTNSRGSIDESDSTHCPHPNPKEERADQIAVVIAETDISRLRLSDTPPSAVSIDMAGDIPPMSLAEQSEKLRGERHLTPPERFPPESKGDNVQIIDMDATPRPPPTGHTPAEEKEEDDLGLPIQMTSTPTNKSFPRLKE
ncbi:uncharacterized protein KY384_004114 [Bacidia gigantensis]|uniref:uncharacterized protein n=1 Tax=Bacidia gigantensis TaxID=2732470 RepID=UPI001D055392|nr:uncharacterized protein KY384_004114 [Bacidia gigantensis]KAG8530757.1 hypothetical protein KY384_004114 [Bacidia gigantensis]